MWIEMLSDQIKAGGIYLKGQRLDPPESIVEQFDEDSWKKSCAPWDVNVPPEQLALRNAEARLRDARGDLASIESALRAAEPHVAKLKKNQKTATAEVEAAAKDLDQAQKAIAEAAAKAAAEAAAKAAAEAAAKAAAELEQPAAESEQASPDSEQPAAEKEVKSDGPEKQEKQKPERKPPKKH